MKNLLLLFSLLLITNLSFSQRPEYDDLKVLFADANYEKLVKKAEGYTLKDKTKKDVLPYIWLSKGLFKISTSDNQDDKFKNAYKQSIKHMGKAIKYDLKYNNMATVAEHEDYLHELQLSLQIRIENEMAGETTGGFKKGYSWALNYKKISINLISINFVSGSCKYFSGDKPGARSEWQTGNKALEEIESLDSWSEADKLLLKLGVLYTAKAYNSSNQKDKARSLLGRVSQWFEEDPDWQEKYDEIVNN